MVQAQKSLVAMAEFFGKSTESIKKKISRLRLKVVVRQIQQTTTSIVMPKDLPSVEEEKQFKALGGKQ